VLSDVVFFSLIYVYGLLRGFNLVRDVGLQGRFHFVFVWGLVKVKRVLRSGSFI
jgi:hypothetical protein